MSKIRLIAVVLTMALAACDDAITTPSPAPATVQPVVFSASGNIAASVDEFRALLGASNGATAGEQAGGRREINWDGAGANPFNNRNDFPADFFNTNVKSGAVFTTTGTGFRNDSTSFIDINPAYAAQFRFFSATKIFAPVGGNVVDQLFQIAGQPTPALVRGFGIVFSDVDIANTTSIQLFGDDGTVISTYSAPVRSDANGLSFIAVAFPTPIIARVRITLGTGALAPDVEDVTASGNVDLVVFDNVIYGEPKRPI